MNALVELMAAVGAVPVLRARYLGDVRGTVACLVDAGLPVIELTLTTDNALADLQRAAGVEGAVVGMGSATSAEHARLVREAGGRFVVAPTFRPELVGQGIDVMLGGYTSTELQAAHEASGGPVKLFPAGVAGTSYLKSVLAPLPDLPVVPSGGLSFRDLPGWYEAGAVAVNLGSDLAPPEVLKQGDFSELGRRARAVRSIIDEARNA